MLSLLRTFLLAFFGGWLALAALPGLWQWLNALSDVTWPWWLAGLGCAIWLVWLGSRDIERENARRASQGYSAMSQSEARRFLRRG